LEKRKMIAEVAIIGFVVFIVLCFLFLGIFIRLGEMKKRLDSIEKLIKFQDVPNSPEYPREPKTLGTMKQCPVCKKVVRIRARECEECGHKFDQTGPPPAPVQAKASGGIKNCPRCDKAVFASSGKCRHCGYRFESTDQR
jgi:hypothetical protein